MVGEKLYFNCLAKPWVLIIYTSGVYLGSCSVQDSFSASVQDVPALFRTVLALFRKCCENFILWNLQMSNVSYMILTFSIIEEPATI